MAMTMVISLQCSIHRCYDLDDFCFWRQGAGAAPEILVGFSSVIDDPECRSGDTPYKSMNVTLSPQNDGTIQRQMTNTHPILSILELTGDALPWLEGVDWEA